MLAASLAANAPPIRNNRQGRIYYAAQVGTHPPTIALVTNGPELFDDTYLRYLTKTLRDHGAYGEVPIKLILRQRGESAGGVNDEPAEVAVEMPAEKPKRKKKPSKTWDI